MGLIVVRDCSLLHDELVNTDESDCVTARYIGDGLDLTAHHDDSSLDGGDGQVGLGSWDVVGSHYSNFLACGDHTGEDTTEGEESTLVVGGDELGDEDHKRSLLIAVLDGLTARIIDGAFIEVSSSIFLGLDGGGKLGNDHLDEAISSIDPLLEDALHLIFSLSFLLLVVEGDLKGLEHLLDGLVLSLHAVLAETDDGLHDELDETSLELRAIISITVSLPLLCLAIEVVVTP